MEIWKVFKVTLCKKAKFKNYIKNITMCKRCREKKLLKAIHSNLKIYLPFAWFQFLTFFFSTLLSLYKKLFLFFYFLDLIRSLFLYHLFRCSNVRKSGIKRILKVICFVLPFFKWCRVMSCSFWGYTNIIYMYMYTIYV